MPLIRHVSANKFFIHLTQDNSFNLELREKMSNQVQNQPTAAYWLSIIGSIIGILGSLALFALGAIAYLAIGALRLYGY